MTAPQTQRDPETGRIYQELKSETCRCGRRKRCGRTFCIECYHSLPKDLQEALYVREGYVNTYRRAVGILDRSGDK